MKRSVKTLTLLLASLSLIAGACSDDDPAIETTATTVGAPASADKKITIGAQDFGESAILAEVYKQGLEAKGYKPTVQKLGGFRNLVMSGFADGTINLTPEYAASMLEFLNNKKGEASSDADATVEKLQVQLQAKNLKALDYSDAVNTNAFVVTKEVSTRLGLKTLSDLASKGKDLKLGGPSDCETNPFCIPGLRRVYNLNLLPNFQALETGQVGAALAAGTIDIGLKFSTDGDIGNYVKLEDDKKMLAADNVVPVVTAELAGFEAITEAIDAITDELTTDDLVEMNRRYDVDKDDPAVIAKEWLDGAGLL